MNPLYIILSLIAIPLIFFTLFSKTEKGLKLKLGSYFIIRDFSSRIFRVRSLNDKLLLIIRLAFTILITILVFDPLNLQTPARESVLHRSRKEISSSTIDKHFEIALDLPKRTLDSFDEDIFFLESLAKNLSAARGNLTIIFNPDNERLEKLKGDIVIFPAIDQDKYVFDKWARIFYLSDLLEDESSIKGYGYIVKKYFRPVIVDKSQISIYSKLENGFPMAFGHIMDIITGFQNNISLSDEVPEDNIKALKDSGTASGMLPHKILLYIVLLLFIIELLLFVYRSLSLKKTGITASIIILLFTTSHIRAGGFTFIELDTNTLPNSSNKLMFSIIKNEAEKRTSVIINNVYYKKISIKQLISGEMPELPYLWIIGCKRPGFFSKRAKEALGEFIKKGGIIFIETCGRENDSRFLSDVNDFVLGKTGYDPERGLLPKLPADHPIYK